VALAVGVKFEYVSLLELSLKSCVRTKQDYRKNIDLYPILILLEAYHALC
jgi:hypothetical protein